MPSTPFPVLGKGGLRFGAGRDPAEATPFSVQLGSGENEKTAFKLTSVALQQ